MIYELACGGNVEGNFSTDVIALLNSLANIISGTYNFSEFNELIVDVGSPTNNENLTPKLNFDENDASKQFLDKIQQIKSIFHEFYKKVFDVIYCRLNHELVDQILELKSMLELDLFIQIEIEDIIVYEYDPIVYQILCSLMQNIQESLYQKIYDDRIYKYVQEMARKGENVIVIDSDPPIIMYKRMLYISKSNLIKFVNVKTGISPKHCLNISSCECSCIHFKLDRKCKHTFELKNKNKCLTMIDAIMKDKCYNVNIPIKDMLNIVYDASIIY